MSTSSTDFPPISAAAAQRRRQLVWPREHGAWGMLFVPLATGAALGLSSGDRLAPLCLLSVAALALFCLRTPVESLWGMAPIKARGREERVLVWRYLGVFGLLAVAAVTALLLLGYIGLLALGAVAGVVFLGQAEVRRWRGKSARTMAQMLGAIGLTSTAAAAYYVITGRLDGRAMALWIANWIFAASQIHFVQLRLHAAKAQNFAERLLKGRDFLVGQVVMIALLLTAGARGLLPLAASAAFLPTVTRGLVWFGSSPGPLNLRRLGFTELAHSIAFGTLLIVSFRW